MTEKLTCQRMIRKLDGHDNLNRPLYLNQKCGAPASEVEIKGSLTTAKAVLCPKHAAAADNDAFLSERGWPNGKVKESEREKGYKQKRIELALKF